MRVTELRRCYACRSAFIVRHPAQAVCSLWCMPIRSSLHGRESGTHNPDPRRNERARQVSLMNRRNRREARANG